MSRVGSTVAQSPTAAPSRATRVREILARNSVSAAAWYGLLDAARTPELPGEAVTAGMKIRSLYAGEMGEALSDVAPYLVELPLKSGYFEKLADNWPDYHFVLFQSQATFDLLHKHLRNFLLVKDERGKLLRFRYYDARVLRPFLPACTPAELGVFFGPISRFYLLSADGNSVLVNSTSATGLQRRAFAIYSHDSERA